MTRKKQTVFFGGLAGFLLLLVYFFSQGRFLSFFSGPPALNPSPSSPPRQKAELRWEGLKTGDFCDQIHELICKGSEKTTDPTGAVLPDAEGEKLALQLYETIIRNHPNFTPEQITDALVRKIYTKKRRRRIELAYQWVLESLIHYFQRHQEFTEREKQIIIKRLSAVKLELPPPASLYGQDADIYTKNEVYFERTLENQFRLRLGGAYVLTARSWFNLVFTFAHELAHAIDPCEIRFSRLAFPAYDQLVACFLETKVIATRKTREVCGHNDQLSEAFADWIAVQISAQGLSRFAKAYNTFELRSAMRNSVRDLCAQTSSRFEPDLEYHPSPSIRIGLFGKHPQIRKLVKCQHTPLEELEYCSFSRPEPSSTNKNTNEIIGPSKNSKQNESKKIDKDS